MATKAKVVEIFQDDGTVSTYKPFSQRLPIFLEMFPEEKGYRVEVKATDMATVCPGLATLYAECFRAGMNPNEAGLPPMPGGMAFRATLFDKEGKAVANATSRRLRVDNYKDFELGETAARQRLLAAVGLGGDILDQDETEDMQNQGLNFKTVGDEIPTAQPTTPPKAESSSKTKKTAEQPAKPAKEEAGKAEEPAPEEKPADTVPPAMLRQIQQQAKIKGVTPNEVTTLAEAQTELKRLIAIKKT